jgi:hypothetical protein
MSAAVLAIFLAFVGLLGTYVTSVYLTRRQESLARTNRQLSEFYGPLLAYLSTNSATFAAWQSHIRADGVSIFSADAGRLPTEEELRQWRLWFTAVFVPNIRKLRQIVVDKADLLVESTMPPVLLDLCAHVAACEILVAQWNSGDYTNHLAIVRYPGAGLLDYAEESFKRLKERQTRLLGRAR